MKTRDRILQTCLRLFNEEGVAKVSTNRIATELDMSSGNLHYHFKSKEQLVEWLSRRLEIEMKPFLDSGGSLAALDDVWLTFHLTFETIEKYRFVYTDVDYLMREFPQVGERIQQMTLMAIESARAMCRNLAQLGIIRIDSDDIDALAFQIVFASTCWSTFTRLIGFNAGESSAPAIAAYHVLSLMSPYLAEDERLYMNYLRGKYLK